MDGKGLSYVDVMPGKQRSVLFANPFSSCDHAKVFRVDKVDWAGTDSVDQRTYCLLADTRSYRDEFWLSSLLVETVTFYSGIYAVLGRSGDAMRRVETDGTIMLASEIWRLEKVNTVWCGGKCGVIRD